MGLNKRAVHQMKEVQSRTGGRVSIIDKVNPYIRFMKDSEKILACDGVLYYENETRVPNDKIPAWFWDEWGRVNEKGKAKVGGEKIERLRGVKADKATLPKVSTPKMEAVESGAREAVPVPAVAKTTKKKAGKKRGRRRIMAVTQSEATNSESTSDGITS